MKNKLVILTSSFPYGKGEKTFLIPELRVLQRYYDIEIISHASDEEYRDYADRSNLDADIQVHRFSSKTSVLQRVIYGIAYLLDFDGWRELYDIFHNHDSFFEQLYQSLGFYILARCEYNRIKRSGILNKNEAIIYYSYWNTYYCYDILRHKKQYPNIKFLTRTHGVELYNERIRGGRQPFKKIVDGKIDKVVFASFFARKYYCEHFVHSYDENKYSVSRLGVSEGCPKYEKEDKTEYLIVSCSNIIPIKRIELIIQGIALLSDISIKWVHFGEGSEMSRLQSTAKKLLGNCDKIKYEFTGYMNNDEICSFYKENWVDCFITTTSTEGGCPVSIQEAMAEGIPIIGTDVGGVTEMINGNGILLSSNPSGEEVAHAIRQICTMPFDMQRKLRYASYHIWKCNFNAENNALRLASILNSM